jgi:hypothetical protein
MVSLANCFSKSVPAWVLLLSLMTFGVASAQDASFSIQRFQVEGNTILPQEKVDQLLLPFAGAGKVYGDVQKALEALEGEYRRLRLRYGAGLCSGTRAYCGYRTAAGE